MSAIRHLLVGLVGAAALAAGAAAAAPRGELADLFRLGVKHAPADVAAARSAYERLQAAHPADVRVAYAYGLVLVNQRRYADALPFLDKYAAVHPGDRAAAFVRLWTLVQARRFPAALDQAIHIAGSLPAEPGPGDIDAARTLGKFCGFVSQAQVNPPDRPALAERTNRLLARLGDTYLPAFDEGRLQVTERFAEFARQIESARDSRSQAARQQFAAAASALEDDSARAALHAQRRETSRENLQDAQRSLEVVNHELANIAQDRARISGQIAMVQAQLAQIQSTNSTIEDPSLRDPANVGAFWSRTRVVVRWDDYLKMQTLALTLAALNRQAVELDKRILTLRAAGGDALYKGQQESQALATSETAVRQAERRAASLAKQLRRIESTPPPGAAAATAEMKRLATYLPLNYEQEHQRVLGWFAE